jgi:hypothetical protein
LANRITQYVDWHNARLGHGSAAIKKSSVLSSVDGKTANAFPAVAGLEERAIFISAAVGVALVTIIS